MTVFMVARIKVRDPEKMKSYAAATGPTLAAYGARLILRGTLSKPLLGSSDDHATSIIEFPDQAAVDAWFASPDYQQHAVLRDEAGEAEFLIYQPVAG